MNGKRPGSRLIAATVVAAIGAASAYVFAQSALWDSLPYAEVGEGDAGQGRRFAWLGGMGLAVILIGGLAAFARSGIALRPLRRRDLLVLGGLAVLVLLGAHGWFGATVALRDRFPDLPLGAWTFLFPFAAVPLVLRMVIGGEVALLFAVGLSLLVGLAVEASLSTSLILFVGALVAATRAADIRDRAGLFRAGTMAGAAQALTVVAFGLTGSDFAAWEFFGAALAAFAGARSSCRSSRWSSSSSSSSPSATSPTFG